MSNQLFVGNLSFHIQWQELKDLFKQAGNVERADIVTLNKRSRGFGTVQFSTPEEAANAIQMFNEYEWHDRKLQVKLDMGPQKRKPRTNAVNDNAVDLAPSAENTAINSPGNNSPEPKKTTDSTPKITSNSLFINNIPLSVNWKDLKDLFSQAAIVERADIVFDGNQQSKGCGIVGFKSVEDAQKAYDEFKNYDWDGRILEIRQDKGKSVYYSNYQNLAEKPVLDASVDPASIVFVGNLPYSSQWQELKDLFKDFGNVVRADMARDTSGKHRGYGQVVMSTPYEAAAAIAGLNNTEFQGRLIEVREDKFGAAQSFNSGSQVYIGNLPFSYRWQDLKDLCRTYNFSPLHAEVMIDPATRRSKGCGIVKFDSKDVSLQAIDALQGAIVGGRSILVRLDKFT